MTNNIAKIRAALEQEPGASRGQALAALAELERAAAQPVAYQYAHPYFGGGKIWREEQRWNGHTSDEARALYAALPTPVARADARIAELERECGALREFANSVMDSWPHGDVDGAYLERMAVEHGLLALKYPRPTEPCGDNCACSGCPTPEEWAEGIDCYVRTPLLTGAEALAALAELERAAAQPVAWMWNDELGIPHASAGTKKPVWLESSASSEYIKQANLRPLYTAPPAPGMFTAEEMEAAYRDGREDGRRIPLNADDAWLTSKTRQITQERAP